MPKNKSNRSTSDRFRVPWYGRWYWSAALWFGGAVILFASGEWLWALGLLAVGVVTTYLTLRPPLPRGVRELMRQVEEEAAADDLVARRRYPEAVSVLDELDEAIQRAAAVQLTDQVRLNRGQVEALLGRLRTALNNGPSELVGVLDRLDALVRGAKAIPLTNQIRIDRSEIYNLLDYLRAGCATPTSARTM